MMKIRMPLVAKTVALVLPLALTTAAWADPTAELHVVDDDEPHIFVERTGVTPQGKFLFSLLNNGNINFKMENVATNKTWLFANRGTLFTITTLDAAEPPLYRFLDNGTLRIKGVLDEASSRELKEQIEDVNERAILERMVSMPVSEWQYKDDKTRTRHVGPMAEDFHQAFGLSDGQYITSSDAQGVLMAAVKGLHDVVEEKDLEIEKLRKQNEEFAARLEKIEASLAQE